MLGNDEKRELRDYFGIDNITKEKVKAGFSDVNLYYEFLKQKKENSIMVRWQKEREQEELERKRNEEELKQKLEQEQQEKENKRKLKNKLKKLRKRINAKVRNITESSNDESSDDGEEQEQVKPYVFFSNALQSRFDENLYLISLLNQYYETNENYKKFLVDNGYEKIKITRPLHKGFVDGSHFNAYMYSGDDKEISTCIHFYVENDAITKLSKIVEIF